MVKAAKLFGNFFRVGFWTLMSRILGFFREILFAAFLGSGALAEAFLVAFTLPNMFRRIFAEGAFNLAFVPMFSKKLKNPKDAKQFAESALSFLVTFLIILVIVAQLIMPVMVFLMAGGFVGDGRFDQAVLLGRIAFPYILFISVAALLSGLLNSLGHFVVAAAAPCLLNLFLILALLCAHWFGLDFGLALAWIVPIAGFAQFLVVWFASAQLGFSLKLKLPKLTPDIKKLLILALPAALSGGVVQINLVIGRQVASFTEGAVAWLSYADRLYQLPLGVVGVAIGVVLLPELSKNLAEKNRTGGNFAFNRASEAALALTMPATVALIVLAVPIISVLFERGAFTSTDTQETSLALMVYAFGLPAFVLQKIYQPVFFAREDTRTPFVYAVISMFVNGVVAVGLMSTIGYIAAAIGTTVASWTMLVMLIIKARTFEGAVSIDPQLKRVALKILLATGIMGGALLCTIYLLGDWLSQGSIRYLYFTLLIAFGFITYVFSHVLLKTWELHAVMNYFRNRK